VGGGAREALAQDLARDVEKLERIHGRKMDVPLPAMPGWVARAENGRKALAQVESYRSRVETLPDERREEALAALEALRRKGELIGGLDRFINARTKERVEGLRELEALRTGADAKIRAAAEDAFGALEGALGEFRKNGTDILKDDAFLEAARALEGGDAVEEARKLQADLTASRKALAEGRADGRVLGQLGERAAALALKIGKLREALVEHHGPRTAREALGVTPESARTALVRKYGEAEAARILGRAGFLVSAGAALVRTTDHVTDLVAMNQAAELASDSLGDAAVQLQLLQRHYQTHIDGFHERRRALETILNTP
jgi:hypothetical protein